MDQERDYWAGFADGWAAASGAIFTARNRSGSSAAGGLVPSLPEAAGNKPAPRRRGRPPKSATALAAAAPAPRRRGRPPKNRPA